MNPLIWLLHVQLWNGTSFFQVGAMWMPPPALCEYGTIVITTKGLGKGNRETQVPEGLEGGRDFSCASTLLSADGHSPFSCILTTASRALQICAG